MIEYFGILFFALTVFFAVRSYQLAKKVLELQALLVEEYAKSIQGDDSLQEQFLKFVSDSREWAFEYIENVQSTIQQIVNEIEPIALSYTDQDIPADVNKHALYEVYEQLKNILPEEGN